MNEKQKQIIFLSNCLYQLESQKEKINKNQPISSLPEIGVYAMFEKNKLGYVNWQEQFHNIPTHLINLGLSEIWIGRLKAQINYYLMEGNSVEEFRNVYMTAIDILINMVFDVISNLDPEIPQKEIAAGIVEDIFNKNYWEGPVVQQISQVRKINGELGFDLSFVQELIKSIIDKTNN